MEESVKRRGKEVEEKGKKDSKVGRCKLDPGLKAPWFQSLIVKSDNSAFNLKPGFLSSHHYSKADAERAKIHEDYKVRWCKLRSA